MPKRDNSCWKSGTSQTKRDAIKAMGTQPIACQKVMEMMVSFSVSFLAIRMDIDQATAAHNKNICPTFIETPGRVITSTPAKPARIAHHLLIPTLSAIKNTDSKVAKIGTVNSRTVDSARETRLKPVNIHNIHTPPTAPLIICSFTEAVFTAPKPFQSKTGSRITKTRDAR